MRDPGGPGRVGSVAGVLAGLPGCAIELVRRAARRGHRRRPRDGAVARLRARAEETSGEVVARDVLALYERVLRGF